MGGLFYLVIPQCHGKPRNNLPCHVHLQRLISIVQLKWLKQLLGESGVHHAKSMRLYCDSQSALYIAQNPVFHERTKHIEADCHFVRDAITDGMMVPSYILTKAQLADIFTKALGKTHFEFLLRKLGVRDRHAPT